MKKVTIRVFTVIMSLAVVLSAIPASGVVYGATVTDAPSAYDEDTGNTGVSSDDDGSDGLPGGGSGDGIGYPGANAGYTDENSGGYIDDEGGAGDLINDGNSSEPASVESENGGITDLSQPQDVPAADAGVEGLDTQGIAPFATYTWNNAVPPVVAGGDTVTLGGAPSGTLNVTAGTVTINGSITAATTALTLNISAGATVNWNANFTGSTTTYLITVTGGGTLTIGSAYTVENTGRGGALEIKGGVTVNVGGVVASGGTVASSDTAGNAIRVSANNATVNIPSGGQVVSRENNGNTAFYISNDIQGLSVNVNGGSVVSVGGGYAICDGTSFTTGTSNNTQITVSGGEVTSGTACAIRSSGTGSKVTVSGGTVSNAAGNNSNPVIYMNAGSGGAAGSPATPADVNVVVSGSGVVKSASPAGYAIQTVGSITVSGGEVSAQNGRAINLVGMYSKAAVSGGNVNTTGTGTAISTATTDAGTVGYASVDVTGGAVSSVNGIAINITGENSRVAVSGGTISSETNHTINASGANTDITVSGGEVSAVTGNAINTIGSATNAKVTVTGATPPADPTKVYSSTGRAIQALGTGSTISTNDNCQVWTMTEGNVIRSSGTVTLNGGFIFAYGKLTSTKLSDGRVLTYVDTANMISAATLTPVPAYPPQPLLLVAWNAAAGRRVYPQGSSATANPDLGNRLNGGNNNYWWHDLAGQGGIAYTINGLTGFFPITGVSIINDWGLTFDNTESAKELYQNDGLKTIAPGVASSWDVVVPQNKLTLSLFHWEPTVPGPVLTVARDNAIIEIADGNDSSFYSAFRSTATVPPGVQEQSYGIQSSGALTVTGNGALNASGGIVRFDGVSAGVMVGSLTIDSSNVSLNATGGNSAALTAGVIAPSITLSDGTLSATGGASSTANGASTPGDSFGISSAGLVMTGGILIASGETRALSDAPVQLPAAYIYWTSNQNEHPGGPGNVYLGPGNGAPYVYSDAQKYVKIIAIDDPENFAYAVIDDVTENGTRYTPMPGTQPKGTIHLFGVTVSIPSAGVDATGWFGSDIPQGVKVTATASSDGKTITLKFSGTPLALADYPFNIIIPGTFLKRASNDPLPVEFNLDARFDIGEAGLYGLTVKAGKGGTVSGTESGVYLPGTFIHTTATANPGYRFTGWTVKNSTINGGNKGVTAEFDMPAKNVTLQANFEKITTSGSSGGSGGSGSSGGSGGSGGSGSSGSGGGSGSTGGSPLTGDNANPMGWTLAMLVSAIFLGILLRKNILSLCGFLSRSILTMR